MCDEHKLWALMFMETSTLPYNYMSSATNVQLHYIFSTKIEHIKK
jgi:hypothetical protein